MSWKLKTAWFSLISLYLLLCYFALSQEWGLDFAAYYGSSHALAIGHSPYQTFKDLFLDIKLSPSPNPPLTLLLFSVFSAFDYPVAFTFWLVFSTSRLTHPTTVTHKTEWSKCLILTITRALQ